MMFRGDLFLYKVIFVHYTEIGHSYFSNIGRELNEDAISTAVLNNYIRAANVFKGRKYWR